MRKLRKTTKLRSYLLHGLLLVLVSLLLGWNLYCWNAERLLNNSMPMPFGYGVSVVLSGSMEPTLSVDDLVLIRQTQDVQVGDVIVYQRSGELIIHRVIEADGDTLVTQGDANNAADEPISRDSVKGCMVGSVPYLGMLVRALRSPVGIIAVLALAILLLELSYRRGNTADDEQEALRDEIRRLKEQSET